MACQDATLALAMPRSLNSWRERRPTAIPNDLAKPQSRAEPCCNSNAGHGQEAMTVCRTWVRIVRDTRTFLRALHALRVRGGRDQGTVSSDLRDLVCCINHGLGSNQPVHHLRMAAITRSVKRSPAALRCEARQQVKRESLCCLSQTFARGLMYGDAAMRVTLPEHSPIEAGRFAQMAALAAGRRLRCTSRCRRDGP
jgi:hypothetical protein